MPRCATSVFVVTVFWALLAAADARAQAEASDEDTRVTDTRAGWPRVHIPDPVAADALRTALDRAWTSLRDPDCARVLTVFSDRAGQPLQARLATSGIGVEEHLTRIVFIDNTREQRCRTGIVAFTEPGTYVVRVCVEEFKRTWQQDQRHITAALIHETLHTLGLGENPPTSSEITTTVLEMCRSRWRRDGTRGTLIRIPLIK
jgi:hypothetical protein